MNTKTKINTKNKNNTNTQEHVNTSTKKIGRPSALDNMDLSRIETLAGMGFIDREIGYVLGVSEQTINAWKRHPAFLESLKKGKAKADSNVATTLYQKALSGDVIAMIFWLKNRMPDRWRDRHELAQDVDVKGKVLFRMPRPGQKKDLPETAPEIEKDAD